MIALKILLPATTWAHAVTTFPGTTWLQPQVILLAHKETQTKDPAPRPRPPQPSQPLGMLRGWVALNLPLGPDLLKPASDLEIRLIMLHASDRSYLPWCFVVTSQHSSTKSFPNEDSPYLYEFPGGSPRPGEDVLQAIVRILGEEDKNHISGTMLQEAMKGRRKLYYRLVQLPGQPELLVLRVDLSRQDCRYLDQTWHHTRRNREIFDLEVVPRTFLDPKEPHLRKRWTKKGQQLLDYIREGSFPKSKIKSKPASTKN